MLGYDLKQFLPTFLPNGEQHDLFSDLKQFRDPKHYIEYQKNFYGIYGTCNDPCLDQGDCIDHLPIISLPDKKFHDGKGFILSNPCDVNSHNRRDTPMEIIYSPILRFDKYMELLKDNNAYKESRELSIRQQQVSHLIYLPKGSGLDYEGLVFLDHIQSIKPGAKNIAKIKQDRIFQLSQSAHYIVLTKIAYHFTRLPNNVIKHRSRYFNP